MAAVKPIYRVRSRVFVTLIAFLSLIGPLFLPVPITQAATIVLDPGHGGNDGGAGSGSELAEKQFTLALSQKIAILLAPRHRVELTRTADVAMAPADRAAVANHLQADLMISLHAAVAPYCSNRTTVVYYHNDDRLTFPSGMSVLGSPAESDADRPAWGQAPDTTSASEPISGRLA